MLGMMLGLGLKQVIMKIKQSLNFYHLALLSSSLLLYIQHFHRCSLEPKRCEYNNKENDNSPNTQNDKNYHISFQKFLTNNNSLVLTVIW